MKSNCNRIRSVEVRPRAVVLPQGKSFSKMPSSLTTNTYVLILGADVFICDGGMWNMFQTHTQLKV